MTISTVFFGSSSFSLPFLEWTYRNTELKGVVTLPDTTQKRGLKKQPSPVKQFASSLSMPVITPINLQDTSFLTRLQDCNAALFITASYGKILPAKVLTIPSLFSINIHPSLLPEYRGADPLFWQIAHRVQKTGVTLFQMLPSLDNGPILKQESFPLEENDTYESLEKKAIQCGITLLEQLLEDIQNNRPLHPVKQPLQCSFYARKRTSADEQIQWDSSAKEIDAFIRAFPPDVAAYTWFKEKRVKILQATIGSIPPINNTKPGHIVLHEKKVYVVCQDGFIQLLRVKIEGKSAMSAKDFVNGYLRNSAVHFFSFHE
jgi:methionyl-tRNA formyltransferase